MRQVGNSIAGMQRESTSRPSLKFQAYIRHASGLPDPLAIQSIVDAADWRCTPYNHKNFRHTNVDARSSGGGQKCIFFTVD